MSAPPVPSAGRVDGRRPLAAALLLACALSGALVAQASWELPGLGGGSLSSNDVASGTTVMVVFAGWSNGGYGNIVMIDHGNGYQTLYGHMSSVSAGCGRSIGQGAVIGYSGSTGNSTGAHLHFEVRYQGGFVSPWFVLPAP